MPEGTGHGEGAISRKILSVALLAVSVSLLLSVCLPVCLSFPSPSRLLSVCLFLSVSLSPCASLLDLVLICQEPRGEDPLKVYREFIFAQVGFPTFISRNIFRDENKRGLKIHRSDIQLKCVRSFPPPPSSPTVRKREKTLLFERRGGGGSIYLSIYLSIPSLL